jgi:hypothetical protein
MCWIKILNICRSPVSPIAAGLWCSRMQQECEGRMDGQLSLLWFPGRATGDKQMALEWKAMGILAAISRDHSQCKVLYDVFHWLSKSSQENSMSWIFRAIHNVIGEWALNKRQNLFAIYINLFCKFFTSSRNAFHMIVIFKHSFV